MKRGDLIWAGLLAAIITCLLLPETHGAFVSATKAHPYIMGFIKVAVLATMGELLALRIARGTWKRPAGLVWRSAIWGLLGISFVVVFEVFALGVTGAVNRGLLPGGSASVSKVVTAFWISTIMNLTFAPTMMALHRVTDTWIDLAHTRLPGASQVRLREVVGTIDWQGFVSFVVVKTIPLFWIPAHTITFLLPPEYRVLMAAMLSIALGAILAFAKRNAAPRANAAGA